jgi:molybdopterin-containing oxidoreductase family iron-sulfur binding subunit
MTQTAGQHVMKKAQWRSIEDLEGDPSLDLVLDMESPEGAKQWEMGDGLSRRGFMGWTGASLAAATAALSGCVRKPREQIVPLASRPEDLIPGQPLFYATSARVAGGVLGLVVKSQDGRPTKIEGNPAHPMSGGATSGFAQAEVLGLYDPDRSRHATHGGKAASPAEVDAALTAIRDAAAAAGGQGLAILLEDLPSPTLHRLVSELRVAMPQATTWIHDAAGRRTPARAAALIGRKDASPWYDLGKARVVVSVGSDFLGAEGDATVHSGRFADGRRLHEPGSEMNRLYCVEANFSTTGAMADHRLRLPSLRTKEFLAALGAALLREGAVLPPGAESVQASLRDSADAAVQKFVGAIAKDLVKNKGAGAILVGDRMGAEAQALALLLDVALGNLDSTMRLQTRDEVAGAGDLAGLTQALQAGSVATLLIVGGNPAYLDAAFGVAIAKAATSLYLGLTADETASKCQWFVPRCHFLESWGDTAAADGTCAVTQPLVAPLFESRSEIDVVNALLGRTDTPLATVQATWRARAVNAGTFDGDWRKWVHDGVIPAAATTQGGAAPAAVAEPVDGVAPGGEATPAAPAATAATAAAEAAPVAPADGVATDPALAAPTNPWEAGRFDWSALAGAWTALPKIEVSPSSMEIDFVLSGTLYDGRYANNGWMQELPDTISKLTWDNAALINAKTAARLGVLARDMVSVAVGAAKVDIPAFIVPGIADDVVVLALGYGRDVGAVSRGAGVDVSVLRDAKSPWFASGTISKGSGTRKLACTQVHGRMEPALNSQFQALSGSAQSREQLDDGMVSWLKARPMVREASLAEWREEPGFVEKSELLGKEHLHSLWVEPNIRDGQQWGMSIDLTTCTGCNACTVACNAENNISVVGKERVLKGREMHWIRLDRYFTGDVDEPAAVVQPIACMQCENAPCEQVCPVAATSHSPEGLNDMAYNRCIGTRYCANNCPYKVRRFNFFNYSKENTEANPLVVLQRNPNVTVRFRGVVEKCTFCVQRIQEAKLDARRHQKTRVEDGAITPACAQVCPTRSIVFGDINDEGSAVSKLKKQERSYALLAELNNKPRTTFLAKIRNPNPELA